MSKRNNCPAWTTGFGQAEFAAPHGGDNSRQRVGLAADFARQQ